MKYMNCRKISIYFVCVIFVFVSTVTVTAYSIFDWVDIFSVLKSSDSYAQKAYQSLLKEDYVTAIDYCDKAINSHSGYSYYIYGLRAFCYSNIDNIEQAFADCNKAIQLSANDYYAYSLRSRISIRIGDYTNAFADCNKAIELAPNEFCPYAFRAYILSEQGDYTNAFSDCNKIIDLAPNNYYAYSLRARILSRRGDYTNALSDCYKAIKFAPDNSYSYSLSGWIYLKQGNNIEAISQLNKAIKLEPDNISYYLWRASAYMAEKKFSEVIIDIEHARTLGRDDEYIYSMLARVAVEKGESKKALNYLDKALQFSSQLPMLLNAKAYILCTAPNAIYRNGHEALKLAEEALKNSSEKSPYIMDTLACAYAELGQFEKAIKIQEEVVEMRQENKDVKEHLAFFKAGKPWRENILPDSK